MSEMIIGALFALAACCYILSVVMATRLILSVVMARRARKRTSFVATRYVTERNNARD